MKNYIFKIIMNVFTISAIAAMSCIMPYTAIAAVSDPGDIFCDDLTGTRLDTDKWLIAENAVNNDDSQHSDAEFPKGWLLWHSYSEYFALDSRMYVRTPDGAVKEISGDFVHAMNGSFGVTPEQIIFMAIDSSTDEWDIYLYDNGNIANLTKNSGFRNEDPKWSPDGNHIVFKRGYWDNNLNDFVYDLALLNIDTLEVTMLTDDRAEDAMPFFSEDGKYIYYTRYTDSIGSIYRMDAATRETEDIYSETGVTAYYPIVDGEKVYFAKWYSAGNHCDQLMCYDGSNISVLPFNSEQYDCSDPCPVKDDTMIYSGTANGGYDLYYYNGIESVRLTEFCSDLNELGADYYSFEEYEEYLDNSKIMGDVNCDGEFTVADVVLLQKWLLAVPDTELVNWKAADLCEDGVLDVFDLCLMKRELINQKKFDDTPVLLIDDYIITESENGWGSEQYYRVVTANGSRYSTEAFDVDPEPGYEWTIKDDVNFIMSQGEKEQYIADTEVLQKISEFTKNAAKYKNCEMTKTGLCVEDYGRMTLSVLYKDENGKMQSLELYHYGGECAWLDNSEVQEFVSMLIYGGYIDDQIFLAYMNPPA